MNTKKNSFQKILYITFLLYRKIIMFYFYEGSYELASVYKIFTHMIRFRNSYEYNLLFKRICIQYIIYKNIRSRIRIFFIYIKI